MAVTKEELQKELLQLELDRMRRSGTFRRQRQNPSPEEIEGVQNRAALSRETPSPALVGAGKAFSDLGSGIRQLGLMTAEALSNVRLAPSPYSPRLREVLPQIFDVDREEFEAIAANSRNNAELFRILADRRPSADMADFSAKLAEMLAVPEARVAKAGARGIRAVLTAARRPTVTTEMGAGTIAGLQGTAESPEELFARVAGSTATGGVFHGLGALMSAGGRLFIGGRPAAIQRTEDLLAAEKLLNATGLLTTGELRGGRILGKIEGVLDNLPLITFGLSGKRDAQMEGFTNAVNTIRAAFPDMSPADVQKLIGKELQANRDEVARLYSEVSASVPADAPRVGSRNYRAVAQELLDKEFAKGDRADNSTLEFLLQQATVDDVPFSAAVEISSDLGRRTRLAERAALDPAQTGIDAGRIKLLTSAHMKDLEEWALATGGDTMDKWQAAKRYFVENVLPFDKRPLAPIFDEGYDTIQLAKVLTDPVKAEKLGELDSTGALGFLLVNDAIEQSMARTGEIDIQRLVGLLANPRKVQATERLVSKDGQILLVGLKKLVDAAPRAFSRAPNVVGTTIGTAAVLGGAAGGAFTSDNPVAGGAFGAGAGLISLGTLRWLVGSRSGRALLTTAARVSPNNRKLIGDLAVRARVLVQRGATLEAGEGEEQLIEALQ